MRCLAPLVIAGCMLAGPVSADTLPGTAQADKYSAQITNTGTDVHQRGQHHETALHWMAFQGNEAMVKKLLAAGADINARVRKGSTPLHIAAYKGHVSVARLLIASKARVNIQDHDGTTPLDWARRNGNHEVAELLVTHGANTTHPQAGTAITSDHSEKKLADLQLFTYMQRVLARHRPVPGHTMMVTRPPSSKAQTPVSPTPTGAFRIQLAAMSTHGRALAAWNQYRSQYPDVLDDRELFIEPVRVNGKELYRVQTGLFTKPNAVALCNQLAPSKQSCLVVNARPLWLAEQQKPGHP